MAGFYCPNLGFHLQFLWPRDKDGVTQCPFDSPILTPTFDDGTVIEPVDGIYWDHGEEVVTSYDDFERVAQEYARADAEMLDARAYTEEENTRADAIRDERNLAQATTDLNRAIALNSAPEELAAVQEATLISEGISEGDPWRQPTGAHDAYPAGALVSHVGANWRSTIAANVWEPGVSGWVTEGSGVQPWVQPTGSHDAYALGAIVTHIDKFWQSNVAANVWEPPTQWTEIPDPEGE